MNVFNVKKPKTLTATLISLSLGSSQGLRLFHTWMIANIGRLVECVGMQTEKIIGSPLVTYIMYFIVILAWGFGWPLTKIGLEYISPIWFVAWRLGLAAICLYLYLILIGKFSLPKKKDFPIILTVGIIQEGCYFLFSASGLANETTSRASLLVYSTPLWVTPISILFFKERFSKYKVIGLILGLIGFLILFNPFSFEWGNRKILISNALLILASLAWAVGILHTRYGKWESTMPVLVAWQSGLAASLFLIFAFIAEPLPTQEAVLNSALPIVYTGLVSSGFGAVVGFIVTRHLPVITTSISLLAVPIIGIITSTLWLQEPLPPTTIYAAVFILAGMLCMVIKDKAKV